MEKRTVLFIVVAAVILIGSFVVPKLFENPNQQKAASQTQSAKPTEAARASEAPSIGNDATTNANTATAGVDSKTFADPTKSADAFVPVLDPANTAEKVYTFNNDLYQIKFSNKGASIIDVEILKHLDGKEPVKMLYPDSSISTKFGGLNGQPMTDLFTLVKSTSEELTYQLTYVKNNDPTNQFTIIKRYVIKPNEYMVQLNISVENKNPQKFLELGKDGNLFTLAIGPKMGPTSSVLDNYQDYRRFVYYVTGRNIQQQNFVYKETGLKWGALDGKYFTTIVIPGVAQNEFDYSVVHKTPTDYDSTLQVVRKYSQDWHTNDTYHLYIGPKLTTTINSADTAKTLADYDTTNTNAYGLQNLKLNEVVDTDWLSWLGAALKWIMGLFHSIIPNWGVSIILLTILIKIALYPLSKKGMKSSARLQELAPKMQAIREKLKDNPQKMNAALAELYQKEKINPLSGCLPLLLQMPFFFAMYTLFNTNFELRGAVFIPGWIDNLAAPESILHLGFTIPFVNISELRLLPILYFVSQLVSAEFTPGASTAQSTTQAKIMKYGLPSVFFFILYNVPSGLLVFWIFQNVFTIGQQMIMNAIQKNKKEVATAKK